MYRGVELSAFVNDQGEVLVVRTRRSAADIDLGGVETWVDLDQYRSLPYIEEIVFRALSHGPRLRIAILGLGGGAMAYLLRHYCPLCEIVAIDSSQDAIYISRQFVQPDDFTKNGFHCAIQLTRIIDHFNANSKNSFDELISKPKKQFRSVREGVFEKSIDARPFRIKYSIGKADEFIQISQDESFDVIINDVFDELGAPESVQSIPFLTGVKRVLRGGGVYLVNICSHVGRPSPVRPASRRLATVFDAVWTVQVPNTANTIAIAFRQ